MKVEIVNEVNRTLRTVRSIDGKSYLIGEDVRALGLLIQFMEKVITGTPAQRLTEHQSRIATYAHLYDSSMAYAPHLVLFFRVWSEHDIRWYPAPAEEGERFNGECREDGAFRSLFVSFVQTMQAEGERVDVKRQVRNWMRGASENAKSTSRYVNYLHDRYARLVVIRLDLHFRALACISKSDAESRHWREQQRTFLSYQALLDQGMDEGLSEESLRMPLTVVASAWRRFHDNMRSNSLFHDKVGHIVCFEYSRAGGYHIHTVLFFDGSTRTLDHKWLAGEIGRYWDQVVTRGAGYHFNCNAQQYRRNGIGVVEYHDVVKRRNLMSAALYLAKKEQFVCAKPSKGFKTFSHGKRSTEWRSGLGRPRSYSGTGGEIERSLYPVDDKSSDIQNPSPSRRRAVASNSGYADAIETLR